MIYNSFTELKNINTSPRQGERGCVLYKYKDCSAYTYFIYVICPKCSMGRWIKESHTNRENFTGLCLTCSSKRISKLNKEINSGCNSTSWSGGRMMNGSEYIWVQISKDSPYYPMAHNRRYIPEHRLIMAQHLGRCLTGNEIVHHINGIKTDNRIENLALARSNKEHFTAPFIELQSLRTRISSLESRNTQLEAEVVLLRAQLEKDGIKY